MPNLQNYIAIAVHFEDSVFGILYAGDCVGQREIHDQILYCTITVTTHSCEIPTAGIYNAG